MHRLEVCPFESYHLTLSDDTCDGPETWERMQNEAKEKAQQSKPQSCDEGHSIRWDNHLTEEYPQPGEYPCVICGELISVGEEEEWEPA